jgi:hypothetical protein
MELRDDFDAVARRNLFLHLFIEPRLCSSQLPTEQSRGYHVTKRNSFDNVAA